MGYGISRRFSDNPAEDHGGTTNVQVFHDQGAVSSSEDLEASVGLDWKRASSHGFFGPLWWYGAGRGDGCGDGFFPKGFLSDFYMGCTGLYCGIL